MPLSFFVFYSYYSCYSGYSDYSGYSNYTIPCASMALATFMKPATLAPLT